MRVQIAKKLSFLFQPYRYKVAYGGRGGSKSRAFATGWLEVTNLTFIKMTTLRNFTKLAIVLRMLR